jgi:hypothetical protein
VFPHPDSGSDRVTDDDDANQVAAAADLTACSGGLGEPFDPASHTTALKDNDGQEGEHSIPAQLFG